MNVVWFQILLIFLFALSCSSPKRVKDFELQKEVWDTPDTNVFKSYLKGTVTIDSVDPANLHYDIWRIDIDKYPDTVKLYTRVFDGKGNFVSQMAKPYCKSEHIYFNFLEEYLGKVYNIRRVVIDTFFVREYGANDSIPYNIALTIDYSGSMSGVMNAIFDGAEMFISMKYPFDRIAFASFNKNFTLKIPFETDKNKLLNEFRAKKLEGFGLYSGVFDAIYKSILLFNELPNDGNPRLVVVFSDGDDNYSKAKIGEIIQLAKEKKVHIFTVAFGYSLDDNLKDLAFNTGGKFYKAYSKDDLKLIFLDIYMSLRNYYLISYKPPKFWGFHRVVSYLDIPGRKDTLWAEGFYDTSEMWKDEGESFVRPIFFDFDKWEIKPESYPIIEEIVDQMFARPKLRLEIQGHTDNIGTVEYNQALSERRAKAVYDALVSRGVEPKRLRWRGFGMSQPIATNETEEGRAKNRRTQFVILAK
ncbi:MAG: OmpA family protein [Ignavibacteria bacterium]|nr:OmpA family protein [Ignavibacteria bacterium]